MSKRLTDAEFEDVVAAEGTWHRTVATDETAETMLAQAARQAREDVKRLAAFLRVAMATDKRSKRWQAMDVEARALLSEVTTP